MLFITTYIFWEGVTLWLFVVIDMCVHVNALFRVDVTPVVMILDKFIDFQQCYTNMCKRIVSSYVHAIHRV